MTATDELDNQFFPLSAVPLLENSLFFSVEHPMLLGQSPTELRALVLGEDPPMVTLATPGLRNLAYEPASGSILGTSLSRVISCSVTGSCDTVHELPGRILDFALADAGRMVVLMADPTLAGDSVVRIDPDGSRTVLVTPTSWLGFFGRSIAVVEGRVYIGGVRWLGGLSTSVVNMVPLEGGSVTQAGELGTFDTRRMATGAFTQEDRLSRIPRRMTPHNGDLLVATSALTVPRGSSFSAEPSRLLRLRFSAQGAIAQVESIDIDVTGMINVLDIEAFGSAAYLVDSRSVNTGGWDFDANGHLVGGRILRVCIPD